MCTPLSFPSQQVLERRHSWRCVRGVGSRKLPGQSTVQVKNKPLNHNSLTTLSRGLLSAFAASLGCKQGTTSQVPHHHRHAEVCQLSLYLRHPGAGYRSRGPLSVLLVLVPSSPWRVLSSSSRCRPRQCALLTVRAAANSHPNRQRNARPSPPARPQTTSLSASTALRRMRCSGSWGSAA